ncbi:hypothetical protein MUK70_11760 [Dyadobacter chenwenxiniae]|uniref:Uncharacterized protein n=1 Tax=Dyadobacter chenwenxiniae TaxID=2906456 RepID=A0A9X1PEM7_9BACT|nr:hypothetical protein [Dyadobacter chenwenxiniae]MCF0059917.1 hypothetical protein [Dyadobacter chenwenxiniae]UON85656.1 hypothetical protein MUK70_11760 [Dyadobacter chenwenxiniae]
MDLKKEDSEPTKQIQDEHLDEKAASILDVYAKMTGFYPFAYSRDGERVK